MGTPLSQRMCSLALVTFACLTTTASTSQIFARFPHGGSQSVDVTADGTLRDVINQLSLLEGINPIKFKITYSGARIPEEEFDQPLADNGIGAESELQIDLKTDTELLFSVFTNKRFTKEALGYYTSQCTKSLMFGM